MKLPKLSSSEDLKNLVSEIGFIPLFKNEIPGFSVYELTRSSSWWTGNPKTDPWDWRRQLPEDKNIAYGKLFSGKSGFISKKWLPYFAAMRRDCYDFDALYMEGKAPGKCKKIFSLLEKYPVLPSFEIKKLAGFSSGGEKGFEGALTWLQMKMYITIVKLEQKRNRLGEFYGWHVSQYSILEKKFGDKNVHSAYALGKEGAKSKIIKQLLKVNPDISESAAETFLK